MKKPRHIVQGHIRKAKLHSHLNTLFYRQSKITSLEAYPLKYHKNAKVCIDPEMSCSHI
jgi:hypothetical protein